MKALIFLFFGVSLLAGCSRQPPSQPASAQAPKQVVVQIAESKESAATEEVLGTVRAKLRATLEAKVSGRIAAMPVELGQAVRQGQLLARLDAAELKARVEQSKATLEQTERDWKRISSLFDSQAVTRAEYDSFDARRRGAQAAMAEAEAIMTYTEVQAPFDGMVARKWADLGDLAAPGKPLIDVEDPSTLQVEADIPEAIAGRMKRGDGLQVRVGEPEQDVEAIVAEMAPGADAATRTFRVKLDLPRPTGLKSGQFARVRVPVGESRSVRLPEAAVVQRGQLEIVFVVTNDRAQMRLVKTGQRVKTQIEILSGLEPGERVITEDASQLADGQPVIVK